MPRTRKVKLLLLLLEVEEGAAATPTTSTRRHLRPPLALVDAVALQARQHSKSNRLPRSTTHLPVVAVAVPGRLASVRRLASKRPLRKRRPSRNVTPSEVLCTPTLEKNGDGGLLSYVLVCTGERLSC